ncbi:antibiotic biosynthesis monooxygenase family protein [Priestia filamentosa]|uniref:Antibiotic biosynthesis monooxygenase n=1 Tax=Priestia filamentosa TaxID=1402861 RepID=A0A1X7G3M4_9BACI|nr:antibiotic biosynthesis monooxygenase [Priestia filamentosa]AKO92067.1 antibiotic biosynthesis monooxygenase [Priestia filamentosa]MDT3762070.1 antibiotic biosynthesis monooxygenase [Priestia filamentosa]OXS65948.1 antibiotic biosynthesis monooxygenase [Priestia filamentosa]RJS64650.1 antibiotic biosynthesis monooxygenase [Priestia filamentosa]WCM17157.1 antibiotic biosynthesis monooxygenase [Priestia filamentosa]
MYTVHSTVVVPEDKIDEVIHIYQNRSKLVDEFEGFVSFQLLQNEQHPAELTVEICWESKEDYLQYITSKEYKKVHELEKNYPDQNLASIRPKVSRYRQVAT